MGLNWQHKEHKEHEEGEGQRRTQYRVLGTDTITRLRPLIRTAGTFSPPEAPECGRARGGEKGEMGARQREAELRGGAFPSRSLGTREPRSLQSEASRHSFKRQMARQTGVEVDCDSVVSVPPQLRVRSRE